MTRHSLRAKITFYLTDDAFPFQEQEYANATLEYVAEDDNFEDGADYIQSSPELFGLVGDTIRALTETEWPKYKLIETDDTIESSMTI